MNEITKTQINSIDTPGNFLQYVETEKGRVSWKIIPLNWVERIIRWLGCFYENTTLPFIAGKVSVAPALPEELRGKMFAIFNRSYPGKENPFCPKVALVELSKITAPKIPLQRPDERPAAPAPKEDVAAAYKPPVVDVAMVSAQNPPETKSEVPIEKPTETVPEEEFIQRAQLSERAAPNPSVVEVPVVSVRVVSPTGMERPLIGDKKISDDVPTKIQTPPLPQLRDLQSLRESNKRIWLELNKDNLKDPFLVELKAKRNEMLAKIDGKLGIKLDEVVLHTYCREKTIDPVTVEDYWDAIYDKRDNPHVANLMTKLQIERPPIRITMREAFEYVIQMMENHSRSGKVLYVRDDELITELTNIQFVDRDASKNFPFSGGDFVSWFTVICEKLIELGKIRSYSSEHVMRIIPL